MVSLQSIHYQINFLRVQRQASKYRIRNSFLECAKETRRLAKEIRRRNRTRASCWALLHNAFKFLLLKCIINLWNNCFPHRVIQCMCIYSHRYRLSMKSTAYIYEVNFIVVTKQLLIRRSEKNYINTVQFSSETTLIVKWNSTVEDDKPCKCRYP